MDIVENSYGNKLIAKEFNKTIGATTCGVRGERDADWCAAL